MAQILTLKPGHFHSIDDDIIDVHGRTIGAMGYAVYGYLRKCFNTKSGQCNPCIDSIAQAYNMGRSTVKKYLHKLHKAGLIDIVAQMDPAGDPTSNNYTLLDPSPAAVEKRLAARTVSRTPEPEGGRSPADPPPVDGVGHLPTDPGSPADRGGRSPGDPEPDPDPLTTEMNQTDERLSAEETPKTPPANPCPHPLDELSHIDERTLCLHCWTMFDRRQETAARSSDEEDQADAACAA